MATTSITITDEAYNFLKSIKGNKSFSKTILSLKRNPHALMRFAGSFRDLDMDAEKLREDMNNEWSNRH